MSVQVVQPKTWRDTVWEKRDVLVFLAHVIIVLAVGYAWNWSFSRLFYPDIRMIVTKHPIHYLPAQYKLVNEVRNTLITTLPIGIRGEAVVSVGFPEVVMSLEQYKETERKEVTHFLDLSLNSQHATTLHYYDLQSNLVLHASQTISSPSWGRLGIVFGYFQAYSGNIEDGVLALERKYALEESSWGGWGLIPVGYTVLFVILGVVVTISGYYYLVKPLFFWLRYGVWRPCGDSQYYTQYKYWFWRDY